MRSIAIAVTQMSCTWDRDENLENACELVREASSRGAQLIVLQELFETPYFCIDRDRRYFELARPAADDPAVRAMQELAAELGVVLPVSFFESDTGRYFNSLAMIDADGKLLGVYRKSHIPDFVGYEEAFYFSPGDTGFMVFPTRFGRIGAAVCWDQWFPEAARIMVQSGAEILVYPTAIGSEPAHPEIDSRSHWQRTMQGHAAANLAVVAASNRVGLEAMKDGEIRFYGSSFIADHHGRVVVEASRDRREIVTASFDLDAIAEARRQWGIFRTRRPDLYGGLAEPAPSDLYDRR